MNYDIFEQAEVMNFLRKVINVVDKSEFPCVYNQIGNAVSGRNCNDDLISNLTEIATILYIFIMKTLPSSLQYRSDHNYLDSLKKLIADFETNKEENISLCSFFNDYIER